MTDTDIGPTYGGRDPESAAPAARGAVVGIIVPDIENAFYSTAATVMAESCALENFPLVLAVSGDDPELECAQVEALARAGAIGVVMTPTPTPRRTTLKILGQLPVVQLVREHEALRGDFVGADEAAGIASATRHLLGLGHRRIGFVGQPMSVSTGATRLEAFRAVFAEHGDRIDDTLVALGPARPSFGRESVARFLAEEARPTALLIAGSRLMAGVVREIAATAASLLFQRIRTAGEDGGTYVPTRAPFAPHLIVRGTTAPCRR
jgi:LacI family transcriptional regulator